MCCAGRKEEPRWIFQRVGGAWLGRGEERREDRNGGKARRGRGREGRENKKASEVVSLYMCVYIRSDANVSTGISRDESGRELDDGQ